MLLYEQLDNGNLLTELERLAVEVPQHTENACRVMGEVIRPALIRAAPFDAQNRTQKHLRQVIHLSVPRKNECGAWAVIWLKPRGISKKSGKNTAKNWNKDKQIYKLVVAEYGRSDMPARPFWSVTVQKHADRAIQAGVEELKRGIE